MDRNLGDAVVHSGHALVALRKESVDRNAAHPCKVMLSKVALRKESVDRNHNSINRFAVAQVALRKESVDRNTLALNLVHVEGSRSPQGERG